MLEQLLTTKQSNSSTRGPFVSPARKAKGEPFGARPGRGTCPFQVDTRDHRGGEWALRHPPLHSWRACNGCGAGPTRPSPRAAYRRPGQGARVTTRIGLGTDPPPLLASWVWINPGLHAVCGGRLHCVHGEILALGWGSVIAEEDQSYPSFKPEYSGIISGGGYTEQKAGSFLFSRNGFL